MHQRLRLLALVCATIATAAAYAPRALADPPQRFPFDYSDADVDTTGCDFPVAYVFHMYGDRTVFVDNTSNQPGAIVHVNVDVTLKANGITLTERDRYQLFFAQDGILRNVGLPTHIQGPGGVVLLEAGDLVLGPPADPSDPNSPRPILVVHGPHPQLNGATVCPALTP